MSDFNLQDYMSNGVANIVKNAVKATLKNPKESIFMAKFAMATKKAYLMKIMQVDAYCLKKESRLKAL